MNAAEGRYGVVRYTDRVGNWYAVTDRKADSRANIVSAFRSRNSAHRDADARNSQVGTRA